MGLEDLMAGKKGRTAKGTKAKPVSDPDEEKINKSIRMKKSTVNLLNKVTFHRKAENDKYTFEDAINDGLTLLAEKEGI